jgi:hypothetical protein
MPEHRGADEDFNIAPEYSGLNGMIECDHCGAMAQYKPGIDQTRCPNCDHDL